MELDEIEKIYKICDNITSEETNKEDSIRKYKKWYEESCALFTKYIPQDDDDFRRFKSVSFSGNGFVLKDKFCELSSVYKILITKYTNTIMGEKTGNKIFVVHGHDENFKNEVSSFLAISLKLNVYILNELPSNGRTIIEKLEEETKDISYAIVLLSPDDYGGEVGEEEKGRARQNVIFEWGYFVGKIGRNRVSAILKNDIEKPSDIGGVIHVGYNNNDWKYELRLELEKAGVLPKTN